MSVAPEIALPYGFDRWYPLVRPASGPMHLLDWTAELTLDGARRTWESLPKGEALVVIDKRERSALGAMLQSSSGRAPLADWTASLPDLARAERFFVIHTAGGRTILIEAHPRAAVVAGARLLSDERLRARWTQIILRTAARFSWHERLGLDQATILWKRTEAPSTTNPFCAWVADRVPHALLSIRLSPIGSKTVVQLSKPDGAADIFVKLAGDAAAAKLIERECVSLEKLEELGLTGVVAPALRWAGTLGDVRILAHDAVDGTPSTHRLQGAHLRFLEHLHARVKSAHALDELAMYRSARDKLAQLENRVDRAWHFIIERLHYLLALHLDRRRVPCTLAHGDFVPWNLCSTQRGIAAFDWEHSKDTAPALYDLFHFAVETGGLIDRASPTALFESVRDLIEGDELPRYGREVIARTNWIFLFGLYLFDIAVHEEHAHASSAVHSAEYRTLREARVRLASIVCDHLSQVALTTPDKQEDQAA